MGHIYADVTSSCGHFFLKSNFRRRSLNTAGRKSNLGETAGEKEAGSQRYRSQFLSAVVNAAAVDVANVMLPQVLSCAGGCWKHAIVRNCF